MSQAELIKLKNALLNHYKYELYCPYNATQARIGQKEMPINEIKSQVDTIAAKTTFEKQTEEYMKNVILCAIDFDIIEITIDNTIFVSQYFQHKVSNSKNIHDNIEAKKELTKEDILPNITQSSIRFQAIKDGKVVHKFDGSINLGYIVYEEFVAMIESLGYNITPKTFDELTKNTTGYPANNRSTIKIDFSQQHKHTK